ncbi:MAG: hypothetical protein HYZ26_07330 [Chloroflexi bacterium]|nr:hypothetical protein [Chloroflexota bacterium]
MKTSRNIILGLVLLVVGGYLLLQNFGIVPELRGSAWTYVFAAASLLFLLIYVSAGWREWGWLFPVTIGAALAFGGFTEGRSINGELVGSLFLWSIAVPFWVARFARRENWWAVIPAGVLTVIGAIPVLTTLRGGDELVPVVMMYGLALVFVVVYLQNRGQWWPIIPAGSLAAVGTVILLAESRLPGNWEGQLIGAALFGLMALTFGLLYWLHRPETGWARYPAIVLAILAAVTLVAGPAAQYVFPLLMIGIGAWLLIRRR